MSADIKHSTSHGVRWIARTVGYYMFLVREIPKEIGGAMRTKNEGNTE
jgi:hypothetical protein